MRTLTTLTVAAALLAGLSIASAQTPSSSLQKGSMDANSTAMGKQATIGKGKYCIETTPGGSLNCKYASLAACQKDAKSGNANCSPNPNASTTGSK